MLHFDTNGLIALPAWSRERHPLVMRVAEGEPAGACSVVWYEFAIGPLGDRELELARIFLRDNLVEIDAETAELAAEIFNQAGRKRVFKTDALIAAAAIRADAEFVTLNREDFEPFVAMGLNLATP